MIRPYCVGLTGGIGAGKSAAAERFARCGAGVVDTDVIAHGLTAPNGAAMAAIRDEFGVQALAPDGSLDRAAMRALVFTDPDARRRLEAILHPCIRAEAERQVLAAQTPYVVLVVPLLLESLAAYRTGLDRILVVDCDEAAQIERTARRPGIGLEQARAILAAQAPRRDRLAIADDCIDNRGSPAELDQQVRRLHTFYLTHPPRQN